MLKLIWRLLGKYHPLLNKGDLMMDRESGDVLGHLKIGALGEKIAVVKLKSVGQKVLYRNYRGPKGGEVDIITRDDNTLCFVEVKTRRKRETSRPLDAVNLKKQGLIKRGANAWLGLLNDNDFIWRYDVVEVELEVGKKPQITIVKGAFD